MCKKGLDSPYPSPTDHWQLATGNRQLSSRQLLHRFSEDLGVMVHVVLLRLRRHQRHVMKRREQNAAVHGIQMHEALEFEVHGSMRFGTILWCVRTEEIFGPPHNTQHAP